MWERYRSVDLLVVDGIVERISGNRVEIALADEQRSVRLGQSLRGAELD